MRVASVGARARLLVIVTLLAATIASGFSSTVGSGGASPPGASAAKSKQTREASSRADRGAREGKSRRARPAADLDARRIAAANADDVAALECGELIAIRVGDRVYCTHGEDPEPAMAGARNNGQRAATTTGPIPRALCLDNGVSGPRVQIVYVHRNDRSNRLRELLPKFRRLAAEMDLIFDQSAGKTGDSRRVH